MEQTVTDSLSECTLEEGILWRISLNIHTGTPMVFVMDPKVDLGTKFIPLQRYSNNLYFTIFQSQFQTERINLGYVYSRTKWLQSE